MSPNEKETPGRVMPVTIEAADPRARLSALNGQLALDLPYAEDLPDPSFYSGYCIVSRDEAVAGTLVGLALRENAAFGNCLMQYTFAVHVALHFGLQFIAISANDRSGVIRLKSALRIEGLTVLPAGAELPEGLFLHGAFFDPVPFLRGIGPLHADARHALFHRFVRPIFDVLPQHAPPRIDGCLFIHIRSGDIFSHWVDPLYVQPPLAFYVMVVERLRRAGKIRRARLVYENKLNPVIDALERHLRRVRLPFDVSSGAIADDIAALLGGDFYVFGFGTFGPGICHLTEGIEELYYFSPGHEPGFADIPSVARAIEVVDAGGGYMRLGDWRNTPEQRDLMVTYPGTQLAFREPPGAPASTSSQPLGDIGTANGVSPREGWRKRLMAVLGRLM